MCVFVFFYSSHPFKKEVIQGLQNWVLACQPGKWVYRAAPWGGSAVRTRCERFYTQGGGKLQGVLIKVLSKQNAKGRP